MGKMTRWCAAAGTVAGAVGLLLGAAPAVAGPAPNPVVGSLGAVFPAPLAPVAKLDTARYLGSWYQLAAVPQPFNLNCARDTTATYGLIDESNISVDNRCTTYTGGVSGIAGNARVNDPITGAALHVSFPGVPFQGGQDGPSNYVVTHIADDYSWALVGDPARLSGFVLSRNPSVSDAQWREIRSVVEARGYNSCLLLTSPTTGGRAGVQPLCTV
ncbi:lipocalin family protein [Tomitella biformata]|uniref:lipocalin family protein n=1 Tax=Tomitella biformata TaxID=630403 RepID=UPI0004631F6B|nr:lipocalin family protein [Tomitella biformata]